MRRKRPESISQDEWNRYKRELKAGRKRRKKEKEELRLKEEQEHSDHIERIKQLNEELKRKGSAIRYKIGEGYVRVDQDLDMESE